MNHYEQRLEIILVGWLVNHVHILNFAGLAKEMRQTLAGRLRMVYTGDEGISDTEIGLNVADTKIRIENKAKTVNFRVGSYGYLSATLGRSRVQTYIVVNNHVSIHVDATWLTHGTPRGEPDPDPAHDSILTRPIDSPVDCLLTTIYWWLIDGPVVVDDGPAVVNDGSPPAARLSNRMLPRGGNLAANHYVLGGGYEVLEGIRGKKWLVDPAVKSWRTKMVSCSISGRGQAPEKVTVVDLFYLRSMDRGTKNVSYLLAQYLFRHAERRKSGVRLSGGHFIGHLVAHFGLVSDQGLRSLSVRQPDVMVGAPKAADDVLAIDEGAQANPAPVQAPQPPHATPRTMPKRIVSSRRRYIGYDISLWDYMVMSIDLSLIRAFDSTLVRSSQFPYQRRAKHRTGDTSTSASQQLDP
nr:hypothetical protein [Tanacetum cinerariifolium]